MEKNRISLPIAYMIETLRSHEISNEELLRQIEARDVTPWDRLNSNFDFNNLVEFAESDQDSFKSIILDGYKVKFITIRGLQTLLQLKFNKNGDDDYQVTDKGVSGLRLEEQELGRLKQLLSSNCKLYEMPTGDKVYNIDLA